MADIFEKGNHEILALLPLRKGKYEAVDARYADGRVIEHCRMERLLSEIAAARAMTLPLLRGKGTQGATLFMEPSLALMAMKMKEGKGSFGYVNLAEARCAEITASGAGVRMKNGDFFPCLWRPEKLAAHFRKEMERYGEKYGG